MGIILTKNKTVLAQKLVRFRKVFTLFIFRNDDEYCNPSFVVIIVKHI